jgi:hypothetical protein
LVADSSPALLIAGGFDAFGPPLLDTRRRELRRIDKRSSQA